jgi:hypothetical protein
MASNEEKLHHLMDGLLYPAVIGVGFVVLLIRVVEGFRPFNQGFWPTEPGVWSQLVLGVMTLCIYADSYVAFTDVLGEQYKPRILPPDLLEVVLIFGCLWALNLLDPNSPKTIRYWAFCLFLCVDILAIQPWWLKAASKPASEGYGLRLLAVVFLVFGLVPEWWEWSDGAKAWTHAGISAAVVGLLFAYEFRRRGSRSGAQLRT